MHTFSFSTESTAPSRDSSCRAFLMASGAGGSMKSNVEIFDIPIANKFSITLARFDLFISGIDDSASDLKDSSVYSL